MAIKDGGPAFPSLHSIDGNWAKEPLEKYAGMSLRDWFAGQALTMLDRATFENEEQMATVAYDQANAMLKAREESNA